MRSFILIFFAALHSPSAFSQEVQQGIVGYGQSGVLQVGPNGMQLIVPDQKTGGLSAIDLNQAIQIPPPATPAAPVANDVTTPQQQQAGIAESQPTPVQPQHLTCECNCPQPQTQFAPQENPRNGQEAGTAAEEEGDWGQESAIIHSQPTASVANEANP